jgi:hypothetical protein
MGCISSMQSEGFMWSRHSHLLYNPNTTVDADGSVKRTRGMGCVSSMQSEGFTFHPREGRQATIGADSSVMDTRGMEIASKLRIFWTLEAF